MSAAGVDWVTVERVVGAFREAGAMTLPQASRLTGVKMSELITVAVAEHGKRLRQKRGADIMKVQWEYIA